jgi:hypothetical protein
MLVLERWWTVRVTIKSASPVLHKLQVRLLNPMPAQQIQHTAHQAAKTRIWLSVQGHAY